MLLPFKLRDATAEYMSATTKPSAIVNRSSQTAIRSHISHRKQNGENQGHRPQLQGLGAGAGMHWASQLACLSDMPLMPAASGTIQGHRD
jgi:hypothetical protein